MGKPTIDQLREQVHGAVIAPDDEGYEQARRVYNAMIDRRPRVVVQCADADDVVAQGTMPWSSISPPCGPCRSTRRSGLRGRRAEPRGGTSTMRPMSMASRPPAGSSPRPASPP